MIRRLLEAGMDVARLNFSHGTHETHAQSIAMVHAAAAELGKTVGILADLQGPKIRTGALAGGGTVNLRSGQQFIITTAKILGDSTRVNTTFRPLPREVKDGDRILLSDGLIELRVEKTRGQEVICRVVNGGALGEHKGINLPGVKLRVPALTPKDREIFASHWPTMWTSSPPALSAARKTSCSPKPSSAAPKRIRRSSPSLKSPKPLKIWKVFCASRMA